MNWRALIAFTVPLFTLLAGCNTSSDSEPVASEAITNVVTEDIEAGIKEHIEREIRKGGGYFRLPFKDKELHLKLVRVHTEYLANLGPKRHFACVDLASTEGNVYDVDFFLAGEPGSMTVTETTVHKLNGQPFYVWKQNRDKTWRRSPVEQAAPRSLGVITGADEFDFLYLAELPEVTGDARMWIPLPATDKFQTVEVKSIDAPGERRILTDREHGNRILFLTLDPADSGKDIEITFHVRRKEKAVYAGKAPEPGEYLEPERLIPDDERFAAIAREVIEGKDTDLVRARAIYDHTIDRMSYMKYGDGWGKGDAVYACDVRTGNCSDFHSYFIALCRAVEIPARFFIGAAIPSERNEGGVDGYHCWAEFYADGKWWPVDISEGDKYSSLATYYFGHHPANRFKLSKGRDLAVEPGPQAGPINLLAYPVLEIDGKPARADVEFFFKRDT